MPKRSRDEEGIAPKKTAKTEKQRSLRTLQALAREQKLSLWQVRNIIALLDDGSTIPFIARYRKEATGLLADGQLRRISDRLCHLDALEARREKILAKLGEKGVLDGGLRSRVNAAETIGILEEVFLPYKCSRETKAGKAKRQGLGKLVEALLAGEFTAEKAKEFVQSGAVSSLEEAVEGAKSIISEMASTVIVGRKTARKMLSQQGILKVAQSVSAKSVGSELKPGKKCIVKSVVKHGNRKGPSLSSTAQDARTYEHYADFSKEVKALKPHEILAIDRGERLGMLQKKFHWDISKLVDLSKKSLVQRSLSETITKSVDTAIYNGIKSKLKPAVEREMWNEIREKAVEHALGVFARNLESLLLGPPMPGVVVMAIDPGFRAGCKIAVCNSAGDVLMTETIYPNPPVSKLSEASTKLLHTIKKHSVDVVAIGNGKASNETEEFLFNALQSETDLHKNLGWCIVSESGASVYSTSEIGAEELPTMDASLRGAVSIARRLLNPLAEYVKVSPHHLGVGFYQHDIKAGQLNGRLKGVVESVVNRVGVELNTASVSLLKFVAGISADVAARIVDKRPFVTREQLKTIKGLGPKSYTQAAGFLRISTSENALDSTSVHPESYHVVSKLCRMMHIDVDRGDVTKVILKNLKLPLQDLKMGKGFHSIADVAQQLKIGEPTLRDIIDALLTPARDIRGQASVDMLRRVRMGCIGSLLPGQLIEGIVRNVVDYGAFVDIGTGKDGLVHVSKLRKFGCTSMKVHELLGVGDKVLTEIENVDLTKGHVSLGLVNLPAKTNITVGSGSGIGV